ncbi:MAG: hypothetical protein ACT4PU_02520 [Planctomycetota bacterium]
MSSEALRLVGHEEARRAVLSALLRGRLGQALLLVGEEGIGKRRFANWVLAARWCTHAERPCGECASCRQVASGNHPDVAIVSRDPDDAADPEGLGSRHEITVDQVRRQLLPWLALRSTLGQGRAVIVDGAEDLNEAAQNALLKTLEEPPPEAVLLLVAAHEEALLPTVRSRCQMLRLSALDEAQLAQLYPELDATALRLARGRPGRVPLLTRLDRSALMAALDALLEGRLGGPAFASQMAELVAAGEASDEESSARRDEQARHRLAAECLLERLLQRALELGEELEPARAALLGVAADLKRHIPPAVAWTSAGLEIHRAAVVGRTGRDP